MQQGSRNTETPATLVLECEGDLKIGENQMADVFPRCTLA
jgi:hypothetical protein